MRPTRNTFNIGKTCLNVGTLKEPLTRTSKIETRENSGIYDSIVFRIRFKPLQKSLASLLWITQETPNRDSRDIQSFHIILFIMF
jgi:hypothetical protein